MNIAIVFSSHHGTTERIAEIVAGELESQGHLTYLESVTSPAAKDHLADADAVVLGSAIYYEQWTPEMQRFVVDNAEALADQRIAVFSVGLTGEEPNLGFDLEPVASAVVKGRLPDDESWGAPGMGENTQWTSARQFAVSLTGALGA